MQDQSTTLSSLLKPTPCAFVWKNTNLTKSSFESKKNYDLSASLGFEEALAELSKNEDFITHFKISEEANKTASFSKNTYFTSLGYGNLELISSLSTLLRSLPESFTIWAQSKKLGPKDFRVMMSDFKHDDSKVFEKIANLNPSKSNGLLITEYYFDLKSSNKINDDYIHSFKSPDSLLSSMKKKRFSKALDKDEDLTNKISKISLSKGVSLNLKRIGDQRLLKLEALTANPTELKTALEKTLLKLSDIESAWS